MDIKKSSNLANAYLGLERKVVGIKFFFDADEFAAFAVPQLKRKITYCNSVQLASKGQAMKLSKENQACPNGAFALNFVSVPEPIINGKGRASKNMYKDIEISKSINEDMLFMKENLNGIAVMPLEEFQETPDIVIVISNSYNIMRLLQGYGYQNGYTDNLRTIGLQALCQDLTTYPYNTQDINISLLCPGTRLVANWAIDEMGIGIPFDKWFKIIEGVIETTNPFERNERKLAIIERLKEQNFDFSSIRLGENYDDGSYSGGQVDLD